MVFEKRYPVLHLGRGGPIYGLSRQLLYLVAGLETGPFSQTVAISEPGSLQGELAALGVDCRVQRMLPWRSLFYAGARYADAWRLSALAAEKQCAIVHAHDVWRAEYAYFIAKRLNIPSVVHVRGPLTKRDILKHRLFRADAIIAIAQRYVDDLTDAGIAAGRITLIDDAVDLDLFSATSHPRQPSNVVRVGVVGRISPEKRIGEFLEIVASLPPPILASAQFQVIGDWVDLDYRRQVEKDLDRLRLRKIVHFTGGYDSGAMPDQLAKIDLLVTLAGGSVMFEAMAMGAAVLAVRPDGRHSQHTRHDETAWCVATGHPELAAEALCLLLTDARLRHRLARAGQGWITQNLGVASMVEKTHAFYERLLASRPRSRVFGQRDESAPLQTSSRLLMQNHRH